MAQPPPDHAFVRTTKPKAAAAVRIGAGLGQRKRAELLELMRPWFVRAEPWLQAGKYVSAVMSGLPERNGWSIAQHAGDRTPDRTQRLLNHAAWDTFAAMGVVRRFAVAGLDEAARRSGRRGASGSGRWMSPVRRRKARPPAASRGSTWGAPAGWRTGSTPCTCRTCGRIPATR
jgi:hypothetical protein